MADQETIMAGVWERVVAEWNAGNDEKARNLERFYTALEHRFGVDCAGEPQAAAPEADR